MALHVVGVRHHSPACARLVRATVAQVRPRFVLIEGPSDMNERMEEMTLAHELPIALFTYRQDAAGVSRGTWSPFCDYSPEWVALQAAREVRARSLFMDLPAWDPAFDGEENRYADRQVRHSDRLAELCARLGFEDTDALWDHLFEQPQETGELAARLARYFEQLRGDEPGGPRDGPREAHMARTIAWATKEAGEGDVVVVCGGYHKPALERMWREAEAEIPPLTPLEEGVRVGSYLVPFSFRRLDSFAGYASGMPSPAFYQAVWEDGHAAAAERMLFDTVKHLRKKQQRVSPADAIAASTLAHGLCKLRGHAALARIDVLDGLAGALVKDALEAPLPWTQRGTLAARTEPLLVEVVAAFSGQRVGALAEGTPQPPLVHDAFAELKRVGIVLERSEQRVRPALSAQAGAAQSRTLHRLRVLEIPGIRRVRGPNLGRAKTDLTEEWTVVRTLETDPALIEAALYGATLEGAAAAKLEERSRSADNMAVLADVLFDAAYAGIAALTGRWLGEIARHVATEPSFEVLGVALAKLLSLWRGDVVLGAHAAVELGRVLEALFDRGLWLLEGVQGPTATLDEAQVGAVRALRDTLRAGEGKLALDRTRAHAVCLRRVHDAGAPPAVRGAALGFLWSTRVDEDAPPDAGEEGDEARAIAAMRALARPETLGDFLGGVFSLAREEVVRARRLLEAIDTSVTGFLRQDFLIALPALRQAFAYFPPRERLAIAEAVLEIGGQAGADPMALLRAPVDAGVVQRGAEIDAAGAALAARFGLADAHDEEGSTG